MLLREVATDELYAILALVMEIFMNISLILSGGSGVRFGSNMPKQYNLLLNKEVIAYSIDAFTNSTSVD